MQCYLRCSSLLSLVVLCVAGCDALGPQTQLEKWVETQKANQKLPKKIGDAQELIDIRAGEMELIQVIRLKNAGKSISDQQKEAIQKQVLREGQKKKNQVEDLINFKVLMTFQYQNKDGEMLHEVLIRPWEDL